jgi:hypothetical protein
MSPSVLHRHQRGRPLRPPSQGDQRASQRSRMPAIRSALLVSILWSIAVGAYFAFQGDVHSRQMTEMKNVYEDRIADLRAQTDRLLSRQVIDQELNALSQRQATLEKLTSTLTDATATASINAKALAPDCGNTTATNGPPVVERPAALAVSPRSASVRHRPRAHRPVARAATAQPRENQAAPTAAVQTDLGKARLTPD